MSGVWLGCKIGFRKNKLTKKIKALQWGSEHDNTVNKKRKQSSTRQEKKKKKKKTTNNKIEKQTPKERSSNLIPHSKINLPNRHSVLRDKDFYFQGNNDDSDFKIQNENTQHKYTKQIQHYNELQHHIKD